MWEVVKDLFRFVLTKKKFILIPVFLVMLALGALIVLTHGTAVAPFVYTVF